MIQTEILVIGDLHLGKNKNNPVFFKTAIQYAEWIKTICNKHNITQIVQLGDIFHDRNTINVSTLNCAFEFFKTLEEFDIHICVGNHDSLFNDTSEVNSLKLLTNWNKIHIHEKVTSIDNVCFCGWGTKIDDIPSNQKIIFGHFDIKGFEMNAYKISTHGFQASELMERCDFLMSGHYHKPQVRFYNKKPLIYAGSVFQLDWGESQEDKFVYILNTNSLKYQTIKNEVSPRFEYIKSAEDYLKVPNNFVSVEIVNPEDFINIFNKMKSMNAIDVRATIKHVKTLIESPSNKTDASNSKIESIPINDAINEYVSCLEENEDDKKYVAETLISYYNRCI